MNQTQKLIVLNIVRNHGPLRSEKVQELAGYKGVSEGKRYLRWLQEEGLVKGERKENDRTKTWEMVESEFSADEKGQYYFA